MNAVFLLMYCRTHYLREYLRGYCVRPRLNVAKLWARSHLMPVNPMNSGAMTVLELDPHETHKLLLVYGKGHNVLGACSLTCKNVGNTQNTEVTIWIL